MNPEVEKWGRRLMILKHIRDILAVLLGVACTLLLIHITTGTNNYTKRLVDCTTPGGKCYEQGRSATTGAVGTINQVVTVTVYCAKKADRATVTLAQIQDCVNAQLKVKSGG